VSGALARLYEAPSVHCEDDDGEINDAKVDRVYPTRALAREHIEQRDPEIENHLLRLEEFTPAYQENGP